MPDVHESLHSREASRGLHGQQRGHLQSLVKGNYQLEYKAIIG